MASQGLNRNEVVDQVQKIRLKHMIRAASAEYRVISKQLKAAFKSRSLMLNKRKVPGVLTTIPKHIYRKKNHKKKESDKDLLLRTFTVDFRRFANELKGYVKRKVRGWGKKKKRCFIFGPEKNIGQMKQIYRLDIQVPYVVQMFLFGSNCDKIRNNKKVGTVKATAIKTIFHIHSQETASTIFSAKGLDPLTVIDGNNKHTVGGRIVVRNSVTKRDSRIGFVTKETGKKLTVEMVNDNKPTSLVVPKPTLNSSANEGNSAYKFKENLTHKGY